MAELNVAGYLDVGWKTSKELTKLIGDCGWKCHLIELSAPMCMHAKQQLKAWLEAPDTVLLHGCR